MLRWFPFGNIWLILFFFSRKIPCKKVKWRHERKFVRHFALRFVVVVLGGRGGRGYLKNVLYFFYFSGWRSYSCCKRCLSQSCKMDSWVNKEDQGNIFNNLKMHFFTHLKLFLLNTHLKSFSFKWSFKQHFFNLNILL